MAEERELPGWPKKSLVKVVRACLRTYGIRPRGNHDATWRQTWEWAAQIANSYLYRPVWPTPREIATQYIFLLFVQMQEQGDLKFAPRAAQRLPDAIARRLQSLKSLGLPATLIPSLPRIAHDQPTQTWNPEAYGLVPGEIQGSEE
jgi:hypothetical protein